MTKLFILPIILLLLSGFTVPPDNIRINVDATRPTGKLEPFWASQIIHPTEFLLTKWGRNFIGLLKETGAANDYIRIYNQPENAVRIRPDGKISYDWSSFDEKAELILSTGNKLKVVFFSMPFELAAFPESIRKRPYGAVVCTSPPKDYKQWEELCADFTRHVHSMQENDRKIESFTFCASGYERIPKADFMGYRTLDTKHGFHKPILNAYKLLYRLAPELVSINVISPNNHISAFATRDSKKITIVVTNYQFDRINNDGPSYPVTLNINSHWTPGTKVELKHWRIDKNHSNAYTAFKELGSPELPNPLEIDAVKKRMDMEQLGTPKQITGKDLAEITFELPCNAVSLIEIVKY